MILPLAVVTTLAATCAPQVAPATLAAIAKTESGLDPFAIGDNTAHRSYHLVAKPEAVALAARLATEGHDLDLGLMQINQRNFGWLGLAADNAFEPCRSLAAGAAVLTAFSRYNTGSPRAGFENGYVARVLSAGRDGGRPRRLCKRTKPRRRFAIRAPDGMSFPMARRLPANWHFRREGIKLSILTRPTDAEFAVARDLFYQPPANGALQRIRKTATSILPIVSAAGVFGATAAHAQIVGGGTDPNTILQAITTYILGPFGQSLAVLGLIAVGISFCWAGSACLCSPPLSAG